MLRTIIIAALAACGVQSNPATAPEVNAASAQEAMYARLKAQMQGQMQKHDAPDEPDRPDTSEEPELEDQHFCCVDVDPKTMTGEGCNAISGVLETINSCANVLYCEGNYTKKDGKVTCE